MKKKTTLRKKILGVFLLFILGAIGLSIIYHLKTNKFERRIENRMEIADKIKLSK